MRLAGLIAVLAGAAAALAVPAAAQEVPFTLVPGEVLLQVQAQGEHRGRPDTMELTAGVVTTAVSAREALAENSRLAARLIEAVRAQGVQPRDVRTSELSVNPRFEEQDRRQGGETGPPRILGYVATNRLAVRLRDLAKAGDVVSALFEGGANSVRGPAFSHADPAPVQREARRAAVAAARLEADTYAEALGMRVVRVLRVSERGRFDAGAGNEIVLSGSRISATPIEPGEIATRIELWIDYALVPKP